MPNRSPIIRSVWVVPERIVTVIPVATPDIRWTGIWPYRWPNIGRTPPANNSYISAVIDVDISILSTSVYGGLPVIGGRPGVLDIRLV
jgi:hypothetical protein